jgi:hypothetical protein
MNSPIQRLPISPDFPLVVSPAKAMSMLDCGRTRLYQLLARGEIESYRDGKSRKILVASILARVARLLAAATSADTKPTQPRRRHPPSEGAANK